MFSPAAGPITLRIIWNQYKEVRTLSENTIKDYEKRLKNVEDWLDLPLETITKHDILNRYMEMSDKAAQANLTFKILRALFSFSHAVHDTPGNPVKILSAVRAWRKIEPKDSVIEEEDLPKWFESVLEHRSKNTLLSDWLIFSIFTGFRKMEGLELSWNEINIDKREICLQPHNDTPLGKLRRTKNGKEHKIPMGEYCFRLIKKRFEIKESPFWVFPNEDGKPLSEFYQGYEVITEKSGIRFTPHDIRRTFATTAETAGVSDRDISRLMNHTPQHITERYKVTRAAKLKEPIQKIEDCLLGLGRVEFLLGKEPSSS